MGPVYPIVRISAINGTTGGVTTGRLVPMLATGERGAHAHVLRARVASAKTYADTAVVETADRCSRDHERCGRVNSSQAAGFSRATRSRRAHGAPHQRRRWPVPLGPGTSRCSSARPDREKAD